MMAQLIKLILLLKVIMIRELNILKIKIKELVKLETLEFLNHLVNI